LSAGVNTKAHLAIGSLIENPVDLVQRLHRRVFVRVGIRREQGPGQRIAALAASREKQWCEKHLPTTDHAVSINL
jgi:hypothetical protein